MSSITLFVVKPIPAKNGLPDRFRVTDVSLNGDTAVVERRTITGTPQGVSAAPEVWAVLDYYHIKGGSDIVGPNDVTFHGEKANESYYSI